MRLCCLTPTYGRPSLVRNALALFLAQKLPLGDTAHLLIFADDDLIPAQRGGVSPLTWEVMASDTWIPLTAKYAPMLAHATDADAYVVWDDDDVYLRWHLSCHAGALRARPWSHPSQAYSTYGGLHLRPLSNRHYHGALAIRADLLSELEGWPETDRSDYDKQQLARCWANAGPPGDPCTHGPPSYVYRWQDTGRDHCSARIRQGRYQPPRIQEPGRIGDLTPRYDDSTLSLLAAIDPS